MSGGAGGGENLYDVARRITDEVLGEGTWDRLNGGNPDPAVQDAIRRGRGRAGEGEGESGDGG